MSFDDNAPTMGMRQGAEHSQRLEIDQVIEDVQELLQAGRLLFGRQDQEIKEQAQRIQSLEAELEVTKKANGRGR